MDVDNGKGTNGYSRHLRQLPSDEVNHIVELSDKLLVVPVHPFVTAFQHSRLRFGRPVHLVRESCHLLSKSV